MQQPPLHKKKDFKINYVTLKFEIRDHTNVISDHIQQIVSKKSKKKTLEN